MTSVGKSRSQPDVSISLKVTDIMDYETSLATGFESTPEYRTIVEAAIGGPLAPRLERLIR